MGICDLTHSLCIVPYSSLWFSSHYVFLGTLYSLSFSSIFYPFWATWSRRRHLWSSAPDFLINWRNSQQYFLTLSISRGSTTASLDNWIHSLEEHSINFNFKLVFHFIVYIPDTCVLAFPVYLLCLADWLGHS